MNEDTEKVKVSPAEAARSKRKALKDMLAGGLDAEMRHSVVRELLSMEFPGGEV